MADTLKGSHGESRQHAGTGRQRLGNPKKEPKLLEVRKHRKVLEEAGEKMDLTFRGAKIRISSSSSETTQARRECIEVFEVLQEKATSQGCLGGSLG